MKGTKNRHYTLSPLAARWSGQGDCLLDPWMEVSLGSLRQRLIAHVDAESQRRSASKATVAPLSPRERAKATAKATAVRFGSKASVVSTESPKSPFAKAKALGRRQAPKGRELRAKSMAFSSKTLEVGFRWIWMAVRCL